MLYRIRLDDPASDHFRLVSTRADSPAEALANALRQEDKSVAFRLGDAHRKAIEGKAPHQRSGKERGQLHTHGQSERYAVTRINGEPVSDDLIAEAEGILRDRAAVLAEMMVEPVDVTDHDEQEG